MTDPITPPSAPKNGGKTSLARAAVPQKMLPPEAETETESEEQQACAPPTSAQPQVPSTDPVPPPQDAQEISSAMTAPLPGKRRTPTLARRNAPRRITRQQPRKSPSADFKLLSNETDDDETWAIGACHLCTSTANIEFCGDQILNGVRDTLRCLAPDAEPWAIELWENAVEVADRRSPLSAQSSMDETTRTAWKPTRDYLMWDVMSIDPDRSKPCRLWAAMACLVLGTHPAWSDPALSEEDRKGEWERNHGRLWWRGQRDALSDRRALAEHATKWLHALLEETAPEHRQDLAVACMATWWWGAAQQITPNEGKGAIRAYLRHWCSDYVAAAAVGTALTTVMLPVANANPRLLFSLRFHTLMLAVLGWNKEHSVPWGTPVAIQTMVADLAASPFLPALRRRAGLGSWSWETDKTTPVSWDAVIDFLLRKELWDTTALPLGRGAWPMAARRILRARPELLKHKRNKDEGKGKGKGKGEGTAPPPRHRVVKSIEAARDWLAKSEADNTSGVVWAKRFLEACDDQGELPLYTLPAIQADVEARLADLATRWPHLTDVLDWARLHLRVAFLDPIRAIQWPPLLLVGPPGTGKTRFCQDFVNAMGMASKTIAGPGISSNMSLLGLEPVWGNARPGEVVLTMVEACHANPVMVIDEIEKISVATSDRQNPQEALLEVTESSSARRFRDRMFDVEMDVSRINWLATANTLGPLIAPLRERFHVLRVPMPTRDQMVRLAHQVWLDLRATLPAAAVLPEPDAGVWDRLAEAGGSIRTLRTRILRAIGAAAARTPPAIHIEDIPTLADAEAWDTPTGAIRDFPWLPRQHCAAARLAKDAPRWLAGRPLPTIAVRRAWRGLLERLIACAADRPDTADEPSWRAIVNTLPLTVPPSVAETWLEGQGWPTAQEPRAALTAMAYREAPPSAMLGAEFVLHAPMDMLTRTLEASVRAPWLQESAPSDDPWATLKSYQKAQTRETLADWRKSLAPVPNPWLDLARHQEWPLDQAVAAWAGTERMLDHLPPDTVKAFRAWMTDHADVWWRAQGVPPSQAVAWLDRDAGRIPQTLAYAQESAPSGTKTDKDGATPPKDGLVPRTGWFRMMDAREQVLAAARCLPPTPPRVLTGLHADACARLAELMERASPAHVIIVAPPGVGARTLVARAAGTHPTRIHATQEGPLAVLAWCLAAFEGILVTTDKGSVGTSEILRCPNVRHVALFQPTVWEGLEATVRTRWSADADAVLRLDLPDAAALLTAAGIPEPVASWAALLAPEPAALAAAVRHWETAPQPTTEAMVAWLANRQPEPGWRPSPKDAPPAWVPIPHLEQDIAAWVRTATTDPAALPIAVLLMGSGGSGKTRLAQHLAACTNRPLYTLDAAALTTPRALHAALAHAAARAPCVLSIDHAETLAATSAQADALWTALLAWPVPGAVAVALNQTPEDKTDKLGKLAATLLGVPQENKLWASAAQTNGTDGAIQGWNLGTPASAARQALWVAAAPDVPEDTRLLLVARSVGWTPSRILDAAPAAARRHAAAAGRPSPTPEDWLAVLEGVETRAYRAPGSLAQDGRRRVAAHECGHAVLAWRHGFLVHRVSIDESGDTLGLTTLVRPFHHNINDDAARALRAHLQVNLGGYVGERLLCDQAGVGVASDLVGCRQILDGHFLLNGAAPWGLRALLPDRAAWSEQTRHEYESLCTATLNDAVVDAQAWLESNRALFEATVRSLMDQGVWTGTEQEAWRLRWAPHCAAPAQQR